MKKLFKLQLKKGFTLVELLVVMALLGVLAAMLINVANPLGQFRKAHDAQRKSDLAQIQRALEMFYQDNGHYPTSAVFPGAGNAWTPYMTTIPADPQSTRTYTYVNPDGQHYRLYSALERGDDPQICDATSCPNLGATTCGSGINCNYGVSSPNTSP